MDALGTISSISGPLPTSPEVSLVFSLVLTPSDVFPWIHVHVLQLSSGDTPRLRSFGFRGSMATAVLGECGISVSHIAWFFKRLEIGVSV